MCLESKTYCLSLNEDMSDKLLRSSWMWGLIFLPTLDFSMQGKVPFSERVTNHTIIDGICKGLEIYLNPASYFRKVVGGGALAWATTWPRWGQRREERGQQ